MKKANPYWQAAGFIFTAILGTFLHFLFDLTNGSMIAALFSAVNESIWEHMKLLFYPMLLFAVIAYYAWGKAYAGFWCVKLASILLGLSLIPILYYTYTGALGVEADWFNVTIFFIAAGVTYLLENRYFLKGIRCSLDDRLAFALLCLVAVVFTFFTFWPPHAPFFQDPITGTYGFVQQ